MKKIRGRKIFYADFETATVNTQYFKKHNDTCLNVGYIEVADSDTGTYFLTIWEMLSFIKKQNRNCIVYFHNLSFDGDFILKWLSKNNFKCVNYEDVSQKNEFGFLRQINKIYAIDLLIDSGRGQLLSIHFRCSLNILSSSVEALGQAVGINKHSEKTQIETFYDVEPQRAIHLYSSDYLEYLKRDVLIIKKAMSIFDNELTGFLKNNKFKNYFNKFQWRQKLTIGAIAYEIQQRYIKRSYQIKKGFKCSRETHELASNFYFGGFCEFNPEIQNQVVNCENGLGLDINSAHPNSMTGLLPYGELINFKDQKPEGTHLTFYEINVKMAVAKFKEVPCLINWNKINKKDKSLNRYVLQLTNFKCWYLKEEWEVLNQFYHFEGVKIVNKWWASASHFLKKYTADLYSFKLKHSKNGDKALANTYKILLNSSYGKHATRTEFSEYYICQNETEYKHLLKLGYFTHNKKDYFVFEPNEQVRLFHTWMLKITPDPETERLDKKHYHKLIASVITSYTRIKILKTILELNPSNFLYTDTDSIYLKDYQKEKVTPLCDDYKLGYWKIEKTFDKFIVSGAKCYVYFNNSETNPDIVGMTYSGINKKWLKDNWDLGMWKVQDAALLKANLKKFSCPSGLVIVPVDYQPKKRYY